MKYVAMRIHNVHIMDHQTVDVYTAWGQRETDLNWDLLFTSPDASDKSRELALEYIHVNFPHIKTVYDEHGYGIGDKLIKGYRFLHIDRLIQRLYERNSDFVEQLYSEFNIDNREIMDVAYPACRRMYSILVRFKECKIKVYGHMEEFPCLDVNDIGNALDKVCAIPF